MTQEPLFPLPYKPSPPRARPKPDNPKATYARYSPKRRTLCDECVRDIHTRGVEAAPYPMPVRWRRKCGDDISLLCETHCRQQKGLTT